MVLERLKAILSEQFDVEESKITPETKLIEDLEADSLDLVDLISSIEDEFDIEAEDEVMGSIVTVGDIANYICDATGLAHD